MSKLKLSVIVPFYNNEDLLERALDTIPLSDNIQLILLDDGSTDRSWDIALDWWRHNMIDGTGSIIHRSDKNRGVAATMNQGFDLAKGEYIVSLSSDDYYVNDFDQFMTYLDGENDLIYFDLEVNDGSVWHVDEKSKKQYVGAVKFMRREFLGNTRIPDLKYKEDQPFSQALYDKNPKEVFTGIVLKHYNWPHEGSLSWQAAKDHKQDRKLWAKNSGAKE